MFFYNLCNIQTLNCDTFASDENHMDVSQNLSNVFKFLKVLLVVN